MAGTNVPTFTFGPTGFIAPSGPAVLAGVQADINAAFSNTLNYSLSTPQGQLAQSWASIIDNTYGTVQYLAQQMDPAYASGRMQDGIGRMYFMQRQPSIPTQLQISCVGLAGVVIPFGALIQDSSGNLYTCAVLPSGGTIPAGGSIILQFNAQIAGPISVPAANQVSIYQAIPGWDTVTVVSGIVGQAVESRSAFEQRRQASVQGNSLGPIGAIIGAVSQVANVTDYFGINNSSNAPLVISGVTVPPFAIYISVAGGTPTAVATAILQHKGAGAPMAGNTTVTVFDNNPLYGSPIPYQITYTIPTPIQILWSVTLVNNPNIPANATTLVQNALVAAATGQSTLNPAPPRVRIGTSIYAQNYIPAITALGSWAQVASILVGSINTNVTTFDAQISGSTMTVLAGSITGTIAVGQFIVDQANRIVNGTTILAGSGLSWTVSNPQTIGSTFTGDTSGSSTTVTVSALAGGSLVAGDVVTGTGIPANTTIVSQTSGTPGGNGVYVFSAAVNLTAIACTGYAAISAAVAGSSSTVVNANQVPQVSAINILVGHT